MRPYTLENRLEFGHIPSAIIQAIGMGRAPIDELRRHYNSLVEMGHIMPYSEYFAQQIVELYFSYFLDYVSAFNPQSLGNWAVHLMEEPYHPLGFSRHDPTMREPKNRTTICRATVDIIKPEVIESYYSRPGVVHKRPGKDGLSQLRHLAALAMVTSFCDIIFYESNWENEVNYDQVIEHQRMQAQAIEEVKKRHNGA